MVHFLQAIAVSRIMYVDMFPFKTPLARQKQVQKLTNIYYIKSLEIRKKMLDPLRAKNTFIRKTADGPYRGFCY